VQDRIKKRKPKRKIEDLPLPDREKIDFLAKTLVRKIDHELFAKKYAPVAEVLKIIGAGLFIASSIAAPNLPKALSPYFNDKPDFEIWKRFNIPYLKRTLERLENQKLVEIGVEQGKQVVTITDGGRRRILKYALDEMEITTPKLWDKTWRLVSYDLPEDIAGTRDMFRTYLISWGFFPLQESVLLHAYPCEKEVDFLREFLGIGEFVRILTVSKIENDDKFREFFGI